jgi:ribosomal protein L12E/L44/L45/RPP1/RPP2
VATTSSGELYPHPPILRGVPQADTLARAAELVAAAGGAPFGPPSSDDMAVAAAAADQQEQEQEQEQEEEEGAVAWPVERDLCAKL